MGLLDTIKSGIDEKKEAQRQEQERQRQFQLKLQECNRDRSLSIMPTFGHTELNIPSPIVIRQKTDGTVYFGTMDEIKYHLIGYEWNGPIYNQIVNTQGNTNVNANTNYASQTVKKGKTGKMAAGAIIGTMLLRELVLLLAPLLEQEGRVNKRLPETVQLIHSAILTRNK